MFKLKSHSIEELEKVLRFKYLPQIGFETPASKLEIQAKGFEKLKNNIISPDTLSLGRRFIKEIEEAFIPDASVRWINDAVGYGLFAEEPLTLGAYAGEYTGIVRKNDRRYLEPLNNYCYEYPVPDEIGRSFVIDATQGHLTRFMNHSFSPNLKPIHIFHDGFYHLIFVVIQPIKKGDQLTYNYGQSYWYLREPPEAF